MTTHQPDRPIIGFYEYAERHPEQVAVIAPDGAAITFGELGARVNRTSRAIRAMGVGIGERIALVLETSIEYLEIMLAACQIGVPVVPVNTHLTLDEVAYILKNSEGQLVFADAANIEMARRAWNRAGGHSKTLVAVETPTLLGEINYASLRDIESSSIPADRVWAQAMLYTAGTTGRPKGTVWPVSPLMNPEAAIVAHAPILASRGMTHDPGGISLVSGPLYHGAPGNWATMSLHNGQTVVLAGRWDSEKILAQVEQYGVTSAQLAPIHFHRLLKLSIEQRERYDTSSLRVVSHAGAATPVDVKMRMIEWLGPVLWEYYAASEGFGTSISPTDWLEHPGSVGRVDGNGAVMKVLDDDGRELPPGEIGMLWIRNPTGTNSEYLGEPEKTAASRRGDLYTAGDLAYIDSDGWVFIVDRRTDLILSGAVNIYPAEVEDALRRHQLIDDVAVIGLPDEEWGQRVHALVVVDGDFDDGEQLIAELGVFATEILAGFKRPKSYEIVAELPYSATGKLLRRELRERHTAT